MSTALIVKNYKNYLKENGTVFQKTDDKPFFEYSFEKFVSNGFCTHEISKDVSDGIIDNVVTEYEAKFRSIGMEIYALIARKISE